MISISLCMIVKNEEKTLARCLSSISPAIDQIVIVDTGSTDKTKMTAAKYGATIADFKWVDDFAAARNFAFSLADKDYIMWLDADDVLLKEDLDKLLQLKMTLDPAVDSVTMKYHLSFDSSGNVVSSLRRNRLVKRANGYRWIGKVHEYLEVWGNIINGDIAVTHKGDDQHGDRNLNIYMKNLSNQSEFTPRDTYYFANELLDHRLYEMAAIYYEKFLEQGLGWVEDNIGACGKLADCYSALGKHDKAMASTMRSFEYDSPRPEFCCRMGYRALEKKQLSAAVFWYELALKTEPPEGNWAIRNLSCSTWLPHLQLCVCYDRLGNLEESYRHNELARAFQPNHPSILINKKYLESKLNPEPASTEDES